MKGLQTIGAVRRDRLSKLGMVLLCLATMVGCQGFSSSKSAATQPVQAGTLSLSGASLSFGTVTAGTGKTMTLTASNTGTASITLSSASISSQYFSLSAPTMPAASIAGQSPPGSLVLNRQAAGTFNATVTV